MSVGPTWKSQLGFVACFTWALFTMLATTPSWAQAQAPLPSAAPPSAEPAGYTALMDEAVSEYQLGHFAEARALFARGAALFPNARAFRGLGMSEFELRDADSVASLERALASSAKPLDGTLRRETELLLERARRFVERVILTLDPPNAEVLVDGGHAQLGTQHDLVLEVGDHILEFRASGYLSERRTIKVRGGELESLQVKLVRATTAAPQFTTVPTATPAREDRDEKRPLYKNPWLWTGVGVAAAALATGLAVGLSGGDDGPTRRGEFASVLPGP